MSVVEAVTRELEQLDATESALGASALAMAKELDDVAAEEECEECGHQQEWQHRFRNSATSKAMCAKELTATLREIRALNPPKRQEDRVDEIAKRRRERLAQATG